MWTWYGTERGPALGWNSHGCCDTPMPQTCCWTRSRSHPEAPSQVLVSPTVGRAPCSAESVWSGSWTTSGPVVEAYPNSGQGWCSAGCRMLQGTSGDVLSRPWTLRSHSGITSLFSLTTVGMGSCLCEFIG